MPSIAPLQHPFHEKLLILRINRLSHIPPAHNGALLLKEQGIPLVVFEYGQDNQTETLIQNGLAIQRLSCQWVRYFPQKLRSTLILLGALLYLLKRISRERPRFILTHGLQEQWLAFVLNRLFQIPYACHVHEICDPQDLSPLNRGLLSVEGDILRAALFTIFPSTERSLIYQQRYGLKKSPFIAFNTPRKRMAASFDKKVLDTLQLPAGSKTILYLGGIGRLNAIAETIEAMPFLPPPLVLLLAGWGDPDYIQYLKEKVVALRVADRVKFLGPVKNKWDWIEASDAGLCLYQEVDLRSRYNAGPSNKLFEFISAGKPVITNDAPDFKHIVERHSLGVTCNPGREGGIAKAIQSLFSQPHTMEEMQRNALALHQSQYHYEFQFRDVLQAIKTQFPIPHSTRLAS